MGLLAFLGLTLLAFALLPSESLYFWTRAVRATDRIGDLSSLGNQSLNGFVLCRDELLLPRSLLASLTLLLALVGVAGAAAVARAGNVVLGVIMAGCVGIVVSPVSWTHHQVWLVLLLAAVTSRGLAGAVLVIAVLPVAIRVGPVQFAEARFLLALAVTGLAPYIGWRTLTRGASTGCLRARVLPQLHP